MMAVFLGLSAFIFGSPILNGSGVFAQASRDYDYMVPPTLPAPKRESRSASRDSDSGNSANLITSTTYAFAATTGNVLEDMSSGTTMLLTPDLDDSASTVAPVGFDFWFDGTRQNFFSANANGLMKFGQTPVTTAFTNDLATSTNVPQIAAYWDDLWIGNNGKVHYKVVGSAPNRKLVVEWQNMQIPRVAAVTAGAGTFQAWIYESNGKIEFVYGTGIATGTSYSVGFGSSATAFASVTTSANSVAYGTANNANTAAIAAGTKYAFTPLIPADPTGLNFTAVGLNAMTLNWTDNATNELGYAIYRSFDGVNYEYIRQVAAGSVSSTESGLASNTNYSWRVYAVTEGGLSNPLAGSQATTIGTMSGAFSVGPTGLYPSITAAVAAINTNGLAGNVFLILEPTYVSTSETFPLVINTVGSPSNQITIRPQSGATGLTIAGAAAAQTINLNGAAYVTIDGRAGGAGVSQLTVSNTSTTGIPVQLINDARNNTLQFVAVNGVNAATTGGDVVFSSTTGPIGNSFNTIDNCDIKDGATTPTNGIFSLGTAAAPNTNNTISNNLIHEFFNVGLATNGILLSSASGNLSNIRWTISNNKFFQTPTRTYTTGAIHSAISIGANTGTVATGYGHTITGNTIGYASSSATGVYTMAGTVATRFIGINVNAGAEPTSIQNNTVTAFSLATSSGATTTNGVFSGINVLQGNVNIGTVTGNTIGSGTVTGAIATTPTTTLALNVGISVHTNPSVAAINIANNTIGGFTANGSGSIAGIQISQGQPIINSNLIGSNATALSMSSPTAAAVATQLNGILLQTGTAPAGVVAPAIITNNVIANFSAAGTSTTAVVRGISNSGLGPATINGNTVHDLAGATANVAVAGGATGIQGILQTGTAVLGATISQNTIYALSATNTGAVQTNVTGIGYSNPTAGVITRNKIYDIRNASTMTTATTPPTASGILVRTGTTNFSVINNMISLGTGQTTNTEFIGIWQGFSGTTLIAHYNSVHIAGTAASGALPSFGLLRGDNSAASAITTTVDIKNNIFNNARTGGTGKHYAIGNVNSVPATGWSATASNNNVLNSATASTVGIWGLTLDRDFANWKVSSGGDAASLSGVTTPFVDSVNGDLHLSFGLTPTAIESGGTVVATTNDYDNQVRPGPAGSVNGGALAPDIGADEIDAVPLDITAPAISYTALANTTLTSNRTLSVTIVDAGGVATGGNAPRVYYRKNAGAYFSTQCSLASGTVNNGSWNCTIDYTLVGGAASADVIDYFVIAQDVAGNVASNPAGAVASNVNTVTTPPTPNSYTILAPFPATGITVGAGGTYASLTNAGGLFQAMNGAVFTSNVTIDIISDLSGETGTNSLNQLTEEGAGSYSVTIRPSGTARTITGTSSATAVIKLNGADRITIDGSLSGGTDRSLNITGLNTVASTAVVWVSSNGANGAQNNTIKNTVITGGADQSTGTAFTFGIISSSSAAILTGATDNDNNSFVNNLVQKANVGIATLGGVTANPNQNTVISGNTIGPAAFGANEIGTAGLLVMNENAASITQNEVRFVGDTATTGGGSGRDRGGIVIGSTGTAWSTSTGGTTQLVTNSNITRNVIHDIVERATFSAVGLIVNSTNGGLATSNTIANNMLYNVTANGTSPDQTVGIGIANGNGDRIVNNSVYLTGDIDPTGATTADISAFGISVISTGVLNLDLRNNISMMDLNSNTGTLLHSSINIPTGFAWGTGGSNFNDWFPTAANTQARVGTVGNSGGTFHATLSAWQTATAQDATSISADPVFISGTDLHITGNLPLSPVIGQGTAIAGVTSDYDGDTRPASATDIGADELVQAAGGTLPAGTYYNAQIASGNTLGGNVTVTNALYLSGPVNVGANTVTVGCSATVANGNASNYIIGNVRKDFCAGSSFTFPVGTTPNGARSTGDENVAPEGVVVSEYTPVDVNITAGTFPSSLTVSVTDAFLPALVQTNAISRYWTVEETGTLTADMTFHYLDAPYDVNGNESLYKVFRRSGGFTTEQTPNSNNPAANTVSVTGVTNFSDWGAGAAVASAASGSISGRVTTAGGNGIRNATVILSGNSLPQPITVQTGAFGLYTFEGLQAGETYVLQVGAKRFRFSAPSRVLVMQDNLTDIDFVANPQE